jgi:N-methylhydantoinase B
VEVNGFTTDVLREGFLAIADEMFASLQRTSQSPIIYEVLDFGVGITDAHGELVSQGNGVAGFLGPLGDAVRETLSRFDDLAPGDVIIGNDPYAGGGTHLSDVALVRPVFSDGELIAFAAAKGHWTEVGGKDPGSWTADSTDVFAEGLQLPFVRCYRGGVPDPAVVAILAANSRLPEMVTGDLFAQAACLEVAERRLAELCSRYSAPVVRSAMAEVLDRSERLALDALSRVPHGVYEASDYTDRDGLGNGPFRVQVRVEVTGSSVTCDFTGSSAQVPGPINCTWSGLVSGVRTVFKAITDPGEPATDGWFRPLRIVCPPGTIFTAQRPAPVAAYFESTEMATDLVWKALAPAFPSRLTAGSYVSTCSTSLSLTHPDTGAATLLVEPTPGGWGARLEADGEHALVSVGDGETYVIPVEVAEQKYGIRVERFGLDIPGGGAGAGAHRGGRGVVREYRILCDEALLTVAWGRHDFAPWGVQGGRDGSPNYVEIVPADGSAARRLGKAARLPLRRGDLVRLVTGTGGGSGDPLLRERAAVRGDLADGLVTEEEAAQVYGLHLCPEGTAPFSPRESCTNHEESLCKPHNAALILDWLTLNMKLLLDTGILPSMARGCAVLGTGGGGDSRIGLLQGRQAIEDFGPVPLVGLDELAPDALVMPCGMIGAPVVNIEKFGNGGEGVRLRDNMERVWGRPVAALMAAEIGGSNGLLPIAWAAEMGLPVLDADGMGRAFPLVPQVTMELAGISPSPAVMTDERGNLVVFNARDGHWMERLERSAAVEFGGRAAATEYGMTVEQAKTATVRDTVSLAISVGEVILAAQEDPVAAVVAKLGAARLIEGKVIDVERRTTSGFVRGSVIIEGLGQDAGRLVRIELQNENLVALEQGRVLASVPDLICVLDTQSADAIATERVKYGQRVTVIAFGCAPVWRTESGLALAGPRAFGYEFDYTPVEELSRALS